MDPAIYEDRADAGRVLASHLQGFRSNTEAIILALPRGGVPVAFEVSRELNLPLDILIVRKLGVPGQEELAFGAVATGNVVVLNRDVIRQLRLPEREIDDAIQRETAHVEQFESVLRGRRPPQRLQDRIVILVDDGLATGATIRAAAQAVRAQSAKSIVIAVPVAPAEACAHLKKQADQVICAATPPHFSSVGAFYQNFEQTTDIKVRDLLDRTNHDHDLYRSSA